MKFRFQIRKEFLRISVILDFDKKKRNKEIVVKLKIKHDGKINFRLIWTNLDLQKRENKIVVRKLSRLMYRRCKPFHITCDNLC